MSFTELDLHKNNIAKTLGKLLPEIDPNVSWADYIPGDALHTGTPLVAIGLQSGSVKYVDVSNKSPFKLVNEVLNAMDDYCLDVQFLNSRQVEEVAGDVALLAKDRAKVASETLEKLKHSKISMKECLAIVKEAQKLGVFPPFFPLTNGPNGIAPELLENFLKTNKATFVDTQILADLVDEQIKKNEITKNANEKMLERE